MSVLNNKIDNVGVNQIRIPWSTRKSFTTIRSAKKSPFNVAIEEGEI